MGRTADGARRAYASLYEYCTVLSIRYSVHIHTRTSHRLSPRPRPKDQPRDASPTRTHAPLLTHQEESKIQDSATHGQQKRLQMAHAPCGPSTQPLQDPSHRPRPSLGMIVVCAADGASCSVTHGPQPQRQTRPREEGAPPPRRRLGSGLPCVTSLGAPAQGREAARLRRASTSGCAGLSRQTAKYPRRLPPRA